MEISRHLYFNTVSHYGALQKWRVFFTDNFAVIHSPVQYYRPTLRSGPSHKLSTDDRCVSLRRWREGKKDGISRCKKKNKISTTAVRSTVTDARAGKMSFELVFRARAARNSVSRAKSDPSRRRTNDFTSLPPCRSFSVIITEKMRRNSMRGRATDKIFVRYLYRYQLYTRG